MPEPTGNAAFDAARAGGVVDTFLAFPDVAAEKAKVYDWIRKASLDKETQSMEMPAQYMFKDIPHYDEIDDPLEFVLTEMERFGITRFVSNVAENEHAQRALREHPDKFWGILNVDPNTGMEALRRIDAAKEQWGDALKGVHTWGTALLPQVPLDDKKMYPIYAKCVEADLPIFVYVGVPGPRIPMSAQVPEPLLLDLRLRAEALQQGDHRVRQHPGGEQGALRRLLGGGPGAGPHLLRAAERPTPRRGLAQVPPRERRVRPRRHPAPIRRLTF